MVDRVKGFFTDKKRQVHPIVDEQQEKVSRVVPSSNKLQVQPKKRRKSGWRVGESEERRAESVIRFEVEELGNDHIIEEAAEKLDCKATLADVLDAVRKRWSSHAQAVWLCDKKSDAEAEYGYAGRLDEAGKSPPDKAFRVELPENAEVISDLGTDGKLYIYSEEIKPHRF